MDIQHYRVYRNDKLIETSIPLTGKMKEFYKEGDFPLVSDPLKHKRTSIIGMFILRPAEQEWIAPPLDSSGNLSIFDIRHWTYAIRGLSGGSVIAGGNVMDGFRLAMQYAVSDAVIVGSSTVIYDGTPDETGPGYMWLPYFCAEWPHLKEADPEMSERLNGQRKLMQNLGYASDRKYPAQIAVSRTGKQTSPDLLEASIFHEFLPEGNPVEAYIVTGRNGADELLKRASDFGLKKRIMDMLIVLSPHDDPADIDLKKLPEVLFNDYDIRIANHDGGKKVLESFCAAGAVDQFNFTFARSPSLRAAVEGLSGLEEGIKTMLLEDFGERTIDFFDTAEGRIPENFHIAELIIDEPEKAVVAVMDTRDIRNFGGR